jgi:hypothetical protein
MSTVTDTRSLVLREASLTICGRREGKTRACNSCLRKADTAVRMATEPSLNTALLPRFADVICGSAGHPCSACWEKATTLLLELRS